MRALVTGGSGFIGAHLVDRLIMEGWKVRVLDLFERRFGAIPPQVEFVKGDISKDYALREALTAVDVVFHLAWGSIHEVATQAPVADVEMNLTPSIHLIERCHAARVRRIIFLSSGGTVYGPARYLPIDESHPTDPISAYGITKLAVEKYLQMYRHLHGLDYVILRPSVPYGPGQDPRRRQGAVGVFLYRVAHAQPIEIWGDGSVVRDYFYIGDLVTAAVQAAAVRGLENGRVFNVGGGRGYTLNELIEVIKAVTQCPMEVEYKPGRRFDVPALVLDTSHARKELGWAPEVALETGVRQTWKWILDTFGT